MDVFLKIVLILQKRGNIYITKGVQGIKFNKKQSFD